MLLPSPSLVPLSVLESKCDASHACVPCSRAFDPMRLHVQAMLVAHRPTLLFNKMTRWSHQTQSAMGVVVNVRVLACVSVTELSYQSSNPNTPFLRYFSLFSSLVFSCLFTFQFSFSFLSFSPLTCQFLLLTLFSPFPLSFAFLFFLSILFCFHSYIPYSFILLFYLFSFQPFSLVKALYSLLVSCRIPYIPFITR